MLLMGKSTISMAMFNSFLYVYQRVNPKFAPFFHSKKHSKPFGGRAEVARQVAEVYSSGMPKAVELVRPAIFLGGC